ncbi:MAG: metallophosphoesterase [Selenomonadaceae bacterium]|nr:metallophosphoesterase [Selenomonadaceae bacterium]
MPRQIPLNFTAGAALERDTGYLLRNIKNRMVTEDFYLADLGSSLELNDSRYRFAVATYSLDFDSKYLHTYDYAPDQIWGAYRGDYSEAAYGAKYTFRERCYFRVVARRVDGETIAAYEAADLKNKLLFISTAVQRLPHIFKAEVDRAVKRINNLCESGDLFFLLLTDTHMTVNGTWQDTVANMLALNRKIQMDGIIHLGDLTDGTVSRELTSNYVKSMLQDMGKLGIPIHIALGNHDANYFHGNPDVMALHEQAELYQADAAKYKRDKDKTYYYADYPEHNLRFLYLSAYQNDANPRYGFDLTQIAWVRDTLNDTPKDMRVLIFSHDAPLPELDPWSEEIRNGNLMMQALDNSKPQILAYIHGHAHADFTYRWRGKKEFPIIAIGCAKCEDMAERKVEGSFTPTRVLGESTQELWDILIIKESGNLHFVRFGAGHDRNI